MASLVVIHVYQMDSGRWACSVESRQGRHTYTDHDSYEGATCRAEQLQDGMYIDADILIHAKEQETDHMKESTALKVEGLGIGMHVIGIGIIADVTQDGNKVFVTYTSGKETTKHYRGLVISYTRGVTLYVDMTA